MKMKRLKPACCELARTELVGGYGCCVTVTRDSDLCPIYNSCPLQLDFCLNMILWVELAPVCVPQRFLKEQFVMWWSTNSVKWESQQIFLFSWYELWGLTSEPDPVFPHESIRVGLCCSCSCRVVCQAGSCPTRPATAVRRLWCHV